MNLTKNEQLLLDTINEMKGDWSGTPYVLDAIDESGLDPRVGRGVVTSLQNKKVIKVQPAMDGEPAYCWPSEDSPEF